ncbi:MAG: Do family serine endopeptidase [Chitinophagales bacterium]|nr:Do family serine endopeptidase [Bacteroidota bacterium]MCB9042692.1 Do family serine endopeptidase [Chitinophagales bacterium]
MKNLMSLLIAAILGSVFTLYFGKSYLQSNATYALENTSAQMVKPVNASALSYNTNTSVPVDFTYAAAKSMPAVVHIKSVQSVSASGGSMDPFQGFFDDDFFSPFFRNAPGGSAPRQREATGSGVIISPDGYIVTNNHVIEDATEVEVSLYDNRIYPATVVGSDPNTDIALIKIDDSQLPILELGNSDDAQVGEWVLAVGNPFNLASTVTAGIVSAKGRNLDILHTNSAIESFIQTDAAVNPGNSGGALVDVSGNLIGINTAIATPTGTYAGYSFAVPVNIVRKVISDLRDYGVVQRAYLGVMIRDLDSKSAQDLGVNVSQGVYVDDVNANSAAQEAGIMKGDVILSIDNVPVKSTPELQEQIGKHNPGDVVNVHINRKGASRELKLKLKNIAGNTEILKSDVASVEILQKLGAEFAPVSERTKSQLSIPGGIEVSNIDPNGTLGTQTDIKNGFVITRIDDKPIRDVNDFVKILQNKRGGVLLEGVYPGRKGVYYYGFGLE